MYFILFLKRFENREIGLVEGVMFVLAEQEVRVKAPSIAYKKDGLFRDNNLELKRVLFFNKFNINL